MPELAFSNYHVAKTNPTCQTLLRSSGLISPVIIPVSIIILQWLNSSFFSSTFQWHITGSSLCLLIPGIRVFVQQLGAVSTAWVSFSIPQSLVTSLTTTDRALTLLPKSKVILRIAPTISHKARKNSVWCHMYMYEK